MKAGLGRLLSAACLAAALLGLLGPQGRAAGRDLTINEMLKRAGADIPPEFAARFSKAFMAEPDLRALWAKFHPANGSGGEESALALLAALRAAPAWGRVLAQFSRDPDFREAGKALSRDPVLSSWVQTAKASPAPPAQSRAEEAPKPEAPVETARQPQPAVRRQAAARLTRAGTIAGVQTPRAAPAGSLPNLVANGSFEREAEGWSFGNNNRKVYAGGAQEGAHWLDTTDCVQCAGSFGAEKTIAYDVAANFKTGDRYVATAYFRSPQGGSAQFVVWEITDRGEVLGDTGAIAGDGSWKRLELRNLALRHDGPQTLRVQIYYKDGAGQMRAGTQYQFDNFSLRPAGKCATSYFAYGSPLKSGSPSMADLFSGAARFQEDSERREVRLNFDPKDVTDVWGQKLQVLYNEDYDGSDPRSYRYYGFTRGYDARVTAERGSANWSYSMFILGSNDGLNFKQVGKIFDQATIDRAGFGALYDGHIAVDYSVCPNRYVMAVECSGQTCASYSTTPFDPPSWSTPKRVVFGEQGGSASTPVFLIDDDRKYASWTVVDERNRSMYSQGVEATDFLAPIGRYDAGRALLTAERDERCTSSWDCNGRDKHDWKKEGDWYYLAYVGSTYWACDRKPEDGGSMWGLGMARGQNPLGPYELLQSAGKQPGEVFRSPRNGTCAMGYPVLNAVDGDLYLYYNAYAKSQAEERRGPTDNNDVHRVKLVWADEIAGAPTCRTLGTTMVTDSRGQGEIGCDVLVTGQFDPTRSYCAGRATGRRARLVADLYRRPNRYYATLTGLDPREPVDVFIVSRTGETVACSPALNAR